MGKKFLVEFSVSGADSKGNTLWAPDGIPNGKIVFPDRSARFQPKHGEKWVCEFLKDSQPGQRKGYVLVRPISHPTIAWRETKEVCNGIKKKEPYIAELPEAPSFHAHASYEEGQQQNGEFEKQKRLVQDFQFASYVDAAFVRTYGKPTVSLAGSSVLLTFPLGEKHVSAATAAQLFPIEYTGKWHIDRTAIYGAFHLKEHNLPIQLPLGSMGEYAELAQKHLQLLPQEQQEEIITLVRDSVFSPEQSAQDQWTGFLESSRSGLLTEFRTELVNLLQPGEVDFVERGGKEMVSYPESEDGYRPAGSHWTWVSHPYLGVGIRRHGSETSRPAAEIGILVYEGKDARTAEEQRSAEIVFRRSRINELLAEACKGEAPEYDEAIRQMTPEEWLRRFQLCIGQLRETDEMRWAEEAAKELHEKTEAWEEMDRVIETYEQAEHAFADIQERLEQHRITILDRPYTIDTTCHTKEEIQTKTAELHDWTSRKEKELKQELQLRGEREIAARGSAEEQKRALHEAMQAPGEKATWFLHNLPEEELVQQYGRKPGEGFGERVAGKSLYLPGSRSVVGMHFSTGGGSRYVTEVATKGLTELSSFSIPSTVRKGGADLRALVTEPTWSVAWTNNRDGEPYAYGFANASGVGELKPSFQNEGELQFSRSGWGGGEGGPEENEVRRAHHLPSIKPSEVKRSLQSEQKEFKKTPTTPIEAKPADLTTVDFTNLFGGRAKRR
ncbi:MAG: hypothetical protein WCV84_01075 [Patescibacteria group bacterium]